MEELEEMAESVELVETEDSDLMDPMAPMDLMGKFEKVLSHSIRQLNIFTFLDPMDPPDHRDPLDLERHQIVEAEVIHRLAAQAPQELPVIGVHQPPVATPHQETGEPQLVVETLHPAIRAPLVMVVTQHPETPVPQAQALPDSLATVAIRAPEHPHPVHTLIPQ